MNSKGRSTGAYESKAFPYFTINVSPPKPQDGNRGGISAMLERCDFISANLDMLVSAGVFVDSDCGFHVRSSVEWELVHAAICAYYFERATAGEGWEHEAF